MIIQFLKPEIAESVEWHEKARVKSHTVSERKYHAMCTEQMIEYGRKLTPQEKKRIRHICNHWNDKDEKR